MSTDKKPRIAPFLWYATQAEEAADFYVSIFPNSRRLGLLRNPEGAVVTVSFELDGQPFTALNGGNSCQFNESVSFVVWCESQQEVDHYWQKLLEGGGAEIQCGWLKDKFGLRWQITPRVLPKLIEHPKAFAAMLKMHKIDIAELERAAKQ